MNDFSQAQLNDFSQARLNDFSQARLSDFSQARLNDFSQAPLNDFSQARLSTIRPGRGGTDGNGNTFARVTIGASHLSLDWRCDVRSQINTANLLASVVVLT